MKTKKEDYWNKPEKVKLARGVRLKEDGAKEVKAYKKGDVVTVSGEVKHELLSRGIAEKVEKEKK